MNRIKQHMDPSSDAPFENGTLRAGPATPRMPNAKSAAASAAVALTVSAWASSFPLIRIGLRELAPLPLAAGRFAVAALCVVAWLAWKRPMRPTLGDGLRFMACGAIGIAFYNAFLNAGQRTVGAGEASFIVNTVPIITAILAAAFLRERFSAIGWIGTAVSFAGITLIASGQAGGLAFGAGASLVLAAACCQAVYIIVQRPLIPRYGALPCTAYTLLSGTLLLTPWLAEVVGQLSDPGLSAATIAAVVALGVVPAAIGYAAWTYALDHFGAARASNFLYLVPPLTTGLSFLLTGESPRLPTVVGGAVAIAGVMLVNRSRQ